MATITKTFADNLGFVPEIWAQEVLSLVKANIVLAKTVARDSDFSAPKSPGDVVNITYPGEFTAQDKGEGTPVSPQTPANGFKVSVPLSHFKTVDFLIEDFTRAQANQNLMRRYTEPAAYALVEALESDLLALYSGLSTSPIGTAGTDLSAATIRQAVKVLNDNKVPVTNRYLVISSKDHIALLSDSDLTAFFAHANPDAVRRGELGPLYGLDTRMSQLVPVVSGSPNTTYNLAYHREAFILVTRPFAPIPKGMGVMSTQITDPDSGLAIRMLYQYDMNNRGVRCAFDILYGVSVLRSNFGVAVLS